MKSIETIENIEEEITPEYSENGIIKLPKELEGAPDDIKEMYIKWLDIAKVIIENKERHFQFLNQKTKEIEQVDAMGWVGKTQSIAKSKNISKEDLEILDSICQKMTVLKKQKSQYKIAWMKYVRPLMGRNVFDWQKASILDWFAKYMTADEVKKKLQNEGYVVDINDVWKFFLRNRDIIEKKRIEFIRSAKDHYLATDAGRMETLAMLHTRFISLFDEAYNKTNKTNTDEIRAISREIRGILEQARKEIKGEEVKLTIDGKIDISTSLQASATILDISKKIPIHLIPVYLVAAKAGINPNQILTSLVNSFYKDFNGFNKLNTKNKPQSTYDLIRGYDWNEIKTYQENKSNLVEETVDYEEMPFVQVQKVKTKRETLKEMLNKGLGGKDAK